MTARVLALAVTLACVRAAYAQPGATPPPPSTLVPPTPTPEEPPGAHKHLWETEFRGQKQGDGGFFMWGNHLQPRLFRRNVVLGFRAAVGSDRYEFAVYGGAQYWASDFFVLFGRGYAGSNLAADPDPRGIYGGELGAKLYAGNRFYLTGAGGIDSLGAYGVIGFGFGPWGRLL